MSNPGIMKDQKRLPQKSLIVIAGKARPTQSTLLPIDEFSQIASPAKGGIPMTTFETASFPSPLQIEGY